MEANENLTRREARENAFLAAFSTTFRAQEPDEALAAHREASEYTLDAYSERLLRDMMAHAGEIDALITSHLKGWTLARIPRVSLVALRLALAEMLYGEEKKPGVAINEAVELVKKYGAETDYQFVNGVLGSVARELPLEDIRTEAEPTC
ncbi:MAG: transcription antitermination factor NusB [Gemmiger sp.]